MPYSAHCPPVFRNLGHVVPEPDFVLVSQNKEANLWLTAADADRSRITCISSCTFHPYLMLSSLVRSKARRVLLFFRLTSSFPILASVCIMDIFNVQVQLVHSMTRTEERLQTNYEQQHDCSLSLSNKLNLIVCRWRHTLTQTRTGLAVAPLLLESRES